MTPVAFDFRSPPPGELVRQLTAWLTLTCRRASGPWSRLLAFPAELKPGSVEALSAYSGLSALPDDAVGIPITTSEPSDGTIVLAIGRPLLLALVAGMVGESPEKLPTDRDPTAVETSLIGYLTRELFLTPLEKGWAAPQPPALTAGLPLPPRAAWKGATNDPALLATVTVSAPFGDCPVHLLVPKTGRWERLSELELTTRTNDPAARDQIEALVREMPVELAVVLGTADLSMHELAGLKAGDVVILRQKVTQPLDGLVSGARKFRVWPGVIGTRAAVVIENPTDD